jgi:hypothetical protein
MEDSNKGLGTGTNPISPLIDYVMKSFADAGLIVRAGTRLDDMRQAIVPLLGETGPNIQLNLREHKIAVESARDFQQIGLILQQSAKLAEFPEFKRRLKRIVEDPALPEDDLIDSPGRDAQCELYVAAVCVKAGMRPSLAEPDVQCFALGEHWGVAVKRIKSERTFPARIKKAIQQIGRVGISGVVIADISAMLNRDNDWSYTAESDEQFNARKQDEYGRFVDFRGRQLLEWSRGQPCLGAIFLDTEVTCHPSRGIGLSSRRFRQNLQPFNQRRSRAFEGFADQFALGCDLTINVSVDKGGGKGRLKISG